MKYSVLLFQATPFLHTIFQFTNPILTQFISPFLLLAAGDISPKPGPYPIPVISWPRSPSLQCKFQCHRILIPVPMHPIILSCALWKLDSFITNSPIYLTISLPIPSIYSHLLKPSFLLLTLLYLLPCPMGAYTLLPDLETYKLGVG